MYTQKFYKKVFVYLYPNIHSCVDSGAVSETSSEEQANKEINIKKKGLNLKTIMGFLDFNQFLLEEATPIL